MTLLRIHAKGMVFGVFDNFHPGHEYFLTEAAKLCEELTVVVTPSLVVRLLKKADPKNSFDVRLAAICKYNVRYNVVQGDETLGSWTILQKYSPDIVILGYDQSGLAEELARRDVPYVTLPAHYPEKYKSSLY